jgi:hypothetical protein
MDRSNRYCLYVGHGPGPFSQTITDRRGEYAKMISMWTELKVLEEEPFGFEYTDPHGQRSRLELNTKGMKNLQGPFAFSLRVKNNGLQPVYGCSLQVLLNGEEEKPYGSFAAMSGTVNMELGILAPEAEICRTVMALAPIVGFSAADYLVQAFTFHLQFTDSAGRTWLRNEAGRLVRVRHDRHLARLLPRWLPSRRAEASLAAREHLGRRQP